MTKLTTTTDLFYSFAQPNRPYLELMLLVVLSPARLHFCSFVEKLSHLQRFFGPMLARHFQFLEHKHSRTHFQIQCGVFFQITRTLNNWANGIVKQRPENSQRPFQPFGRLSPVRDAFLKHLVPETVAIGRGGWSRFIYDIRPLWLILRMHPIFRSIHNLHGVRKVHGNIQWASRYDVYKFFGFFEPLPLA